MKLKIKSFIARVVKAPMTRATALVLAAAESHDAFAQAGWATAATNVQSLAQLIANVAVWVCFAAGVVAFGYAGFKLWEKSEDRADVKTKHWLFPMLGGAFLVAIGYVALLTVQTLGGSAANMHQTF